MPTTTTPQQQRARDAYALLRQEFATALRVNPALPVSVGDTSEPLVEVVRALLLADADNTILTNVLRVIARHMDDDEAATAAFISLGHLYASVEVDALEACHAFSD